MPDLSDALALIDQRLADTRTSLARESGRPTYNRGWLDGQLHVLGQLREQLDPDPDPRCVCGTHLSEHALCGCPDGFERAR